MDSRNYSTIEALELRIVLAGSFDALNAKLAEFAADKTTPTTPPAPPAVPKVPTLLTAKADDVVFAVYQLTLTDDFDERAEVSDLLVTALEALNGKVRADKDTIAPRLLNAALLGSGLTDANDVAQIMADLADVNAGTAKFQLSDAGKAAVVGQALISTNNGDPFAGREIGDFAALVFDASSAVNPDAKLATLTISALRGVGTATSQVRSFIDSILDGVEDSTEAFALKVAEALTKNPAAVGGVIGGLADDLNFPADIKSMTVRAINDTKLSQTISFIVAATTTGAGGDPAQFAGDLVLGLGTKATAVNRGAVASGVIQNVTSTDVANVIDKALTNKTLTKAELSTFAGSAATRTGNLAGDVVAKVAAIADLVAPGDLTVRKNIGIAALKGIATTTPDAGKVIAQKLVVAGMALFDTDAEKTDLAKALAKGVSTSGPTAGAAVAGVGLTLNANTPTPQLLADLTAAAIPSASKAAINIAKEVSALNAVTDYTGFATKVVKTLNFSSANVASVAAGVAATSLQVAGGHPAANSGQTAGDIAAAVANADVKFQPKLATIAGAVALAVDVESIAGLSAKVAAIYQQSASTSKLPKLSAIGTLATSLAKAINTKPFVATANRVDEAGELAAELTRQAIAVLGPNATEAALASALSTIGSSVMKGLSSALLINGGSFAADLKDAARDIAGAIAQTVQVTLGLSSNAGRVTIANNLTKLGGTLEKALEKAAKKFAGDVKTAFGDVNGAQANADRLVPGTEALGVGEVQTGQFGRYEIGSLIDAGSLVPSF